MDNSFIEQLKLKYYSTLKLRDSLHRELTQLNQPSTSASYLGELEARIEEVDEECCLISYRLSVLLDNTND
jgi:hypothetical protein